MSATGAARPNDRSAHPPDRRGVRGAVAATADGGALRARPPGRRGPAVDARAGAACRRSARDHDPAGAAPRPRRLRRGARALRRRGARRHAGLRRQGGRSGRGPEAARRSGARVGHGAIARPSDRAARRAGRARTSGRCGRPTARGAAHLLPRPALLPRRCLALPLHAVAARRQDGDARRCRRHRPRRAARRRPRGHPAGGERRALCPRHGRGGALRRGRGRAGGGAHRFGSLAARPDRLGHDPGRDRQPVLLPQHDAAARRRARSWRRWSPAAPARRRSTPSPAPRRSSPPSVSTCRAAAPGNTHDAHPSPHHRRQPARRRRRQGHRDRSMPRASAISTPRAAPRSPASATAIPTCIAAMHAQLDKLAYAHTSFFTTEVAEQLADRLVADAPAGHRPRLSASAAARRRSRRRSRWRASISSRAASRSARHVIARRQSYHGNTLGALAVGGNEWRRAPVRAAADRRRTTSSPCYAYRDQRAGESDGGLRRACRRTSWRRRSSSSGRDNVIAFVAETVVGATAGAVPPVAGLLQARPRDLRPLRRAADPRRGDVRHGPHRHAARLRAGRHRARPDGHRQGPRRRLPADRRGAASTSASSTRSRDGSGVFQHGHTYIGHPMACAAALAVQQVDRSATTCSPTCSAMGALPASGGCSERFGNHPHVGDIRGRGLFRGDRARRGPRDQGAVRSRAASCTRASSARRWRAA